MKSINFHIAILFLLILFSVFSCAVDKAKPVAEIEKNNESVENLHKQAVELQQAGELRSATELYTQLIELNSKAMSPLSVELYTPRAYKLN